MEAGASELLECWLAQCGTEAPPTVSSPQGGNHKERSGARAGPGDCCLLELAVEGSIRGQQIRPGETGEMTFPGGDWKVPVLLQAYREWLSPRITTLF